MKKSARAKGDDIGGLLSDLPENARKKLKKRKQPTWTSPMLATLTKRRFSGPDWIFERKLDGERCLAFRKDGRARLLSRNRKKLNHTYPEIVEALASQPADDFIVDGEIVAFENGLTSFSRLQSRMQIKDPHKARRSGIAVYYYVFDLLHLAGHDTTKLELRDRKALLRKALSFKDPLRFTLHRKACGEDYYEEACGKGWEGLIAKRAESAYVHSRSRNWLKFKCVNRQELVIGGYTNPQGERGGFGALLVGYYERGKLKYAGKVGTGFDEETLESLGKRLASLERTTSPFEADDPPAKGVHWATPRLVAEVGFTEWTDDGKLRHPRYLGLRRDKEARDVKREGPKK